MRWKERLRIASPEVVRLDGRTLLAGGLLGGLAEAFGSGAGYLGFPGVKFLLGFVLARLVLVLADLLRRDRLYPIEIRRHRKAYRRGQERVRRLRKQCWPTGWARFQKKPPLSKEDQKTLHRIEDLVGEIDRQFDVADPFIQRQL